MYPFRRVARPVDVKDDFETGCPIRPSFGRVAILTFDLPAHDGMGKTTTDNLGQTYSYDAEGRPVSVSGKSILYDAFNRAVEIQSGGNYTQIVYAPDGYNRGPRQTPLLRLLGWKFAIMSGQSVQMYFAPLAGGLQAVYTAATPAAPAYWRHVDWLGSSRLASTPARTTKYNVSYAPFGETYNESGSPDRSFTGQTQDIYPGAIGSYDFLFRQHSAAQGRWLVPDPGFWE